MSQAKQILAFGSENVAELCYNAMLVTKFLGEVAPAMANNSNNTVGLSEDGANGLMMILDLVENTLATVVERL